MAQLMKWIFLTIIFLGSSVAPAEPERDKGVSMHMIPKRVADLMNKRWGFVVDYAEHLQAERAEPIIQTTQEFVAYVHKQTENVQANGVWIVITNPDAYSAPEKNLLEEIKLTAKQNKIPLFVARASQLPNGWSRYDKTP